MRKLLFFLLVLSFGIAIGAVGAKLHSRRAWARAQQVWLNPQINLCSDVPCPHYTSRRAAIESIIHQRGSEPSYLALGDSTVELADLPEICGRRPINGGIGSATVDTFAKSARYFAELARPDFIIVNLGTNDLLKGKGDVFPEKMASLLFSLREWPVIVAPIPEAPGAKGAAQLNAVLENLDAIKSARLRDVETISDGIHQTANSYARWKRSLIDTANESICPLLRGR